MACDAATLRWGCNLTALPGRVDTAKMATVCRRWIVRTGLLGVLPSPRDSRGTQRHPGEPVIVRLLTARVAGGDAPAVVAALRRTLSEMKRQPGMEYVKLARRLTEDGEDLVLFEEWATPADLYRWTGGDLRRPRLEAEIAALLHNLVITHYESLDRTPGELGLDLVASDADPESYAAPG